VDLRETALETIGVLMMAAELTVFIATAVLTATAFVVERRRRFAICSVLWSCGNDGVTLVSHFESHRRLVPFSSWPSAVSDEHVSMASALYVCD